MTPPVTLASPAFARSLFARGTDAIGAEEIMRAFNMTLPSADMSVIPPIPFTEAELQRAHALGHYLILQVGAGKNGRLLTMQSMHDDTKNKLGKGKLLYDTDWYGKEDFYTKDTPRVGWRLVSREVIPGSTSGDYIAQTQAIVDYLLGKVYEAEEPPAPYKEAVTEFVARKAELEQLMSDDWEKCAAECADLKINQLFREKPVEVIYGLVVQHAINNEYLLGGMYTWTSTRSSDGYLVRVGGAGAVGVYVDGDDPGRSRSYLGVRFSRSAVPTSES